MFFLCSGISHAISSDGFFELEVLPKKACVVGAGYIAVELSMILQTLGSDVHLLIRQNQVLRSFDSSIVTACTEAIEACGITVELENSQNYRNLNMITIIFTET